MRWNGIYLVLCGLCACAGLEPGLSAENLKSSTADGSQASIACDDGANDGDCKFAANGCDSTAPATVDPWCVEQLAICSKGGTDAELDCKLIHEKCRPVGPPAPTASTSCYDEAKLCYEKGADKQICSELERKCSEPPSTAVDPWCAEQLAICSKDANGAELDCKLIHEKCQPVIPPPPAANTSCYDHVKLCYQKGMDEEICVALEQKCGLAPIKPD